MQPNGVALRVLAAVLLSGFLYLLLWPTPIDPAAWRPPAAPDLTGTFAPNMHLGALERLDLGEGVGPEDVAIDSGGRIYAGLEDGRIVRFGASGDTLHTFTHTGGRPLGMHHDSAGNLIVADGMRGLLSIDEAGVVTVLTTEQGGVPLQLADDVDIAADGTIYFSDASSKFTVSESTLDLLEHRPNGRLLAYDPRTKETRLVLDSLYFANGVAVSPDQDFVLVVETAKYRVRRLWLQGPRAGAAEVFIDNLPGFPDGISSNGAGIFWLALVSPRLANVDRWLLPYPVLRRVMSRLPHAMQPRPSSYGFILGLDSSGRVIHNLQDPAGSFAQITSVEEHQGILYLGSLVERAVGRLPAPQ